VSRWQSDGVMGGEAWRFLPMVTSDEGVEVSRLHPLPLKGDGWSHVRTRQFVDVSVEQVAE